MKYIEKQKNSSIYSLRSKNEVLNTWSDYIAECKILKYNLDDPYQSMPPDLLKAHGKTMKLVSDLQDKKLNEKIKARAGQLKKYCFEEEGLIIRPAESVAELKDEGNRLHHCVATYAERYADGKTTILFVREAKSLESPFVTVEYRGGGIVQARTLNNGEPSENVKRFLEKWEKQLKMKKEAA